MKSTTETAMQETLFQGGIDEEEEYKYGVSQKNLRRRLYGTAVAHVANAQLDHTGGS